MAEDRDIMADMAVAQVTGGSPIDAIKNSIIPGEKSDAAVTNVGTAIVDVAALAGVGSAAATLVLTEGTTVTIASSLTTAISPYAAYQKRKCDDIGSVREEHNRLRGNVNELMQENDKLKENVDQLEVSVSSLENVEKDLSKLANTSNLDRLVAVVNEQKRATANIKRILKNDIMVQVMRVLMDSDRNQDFVIGPNEIMMMILRMRNVNGVKFNEKNFRERVASEGSMSLTEIMDLFRDLEDDDIDEENAIFTMDISHLKQ
mmetsp:Transcript_31284/g.46671  ORF Transcript_31284/g.46671 Transcript_31284/m.46671 type:complete len:261 (-) Transcript_31284:212-994(-)